MDDLIIRILSIDWIKWILSTIIGACIVAVVGYIVSKKQFDDQVQLTLRNVSLSLIDEIEFLEKIIQPFVNEYKINGFDFVSDEPNNPKAYMIQSAFFLENNITSDVIGFLYDEKGAYYQNIETIPNFEEESFSKISGFYRNIIYAQKYYRLYEKNTQSTFFLSKCYEHLTEAAQTSQALKTLLQDRYIK